MSNNKKRKSKNKANVKVINKSNNKLKKRSNIEARKPNAKKAKKRLIDKGILNNNNKKRKLNNNNNNNNNKKSFNKKRYFKDDDTTIVNNKPLIHKRRNVNNNNDNSDSDDNEIKEYEIAPRKWNIDEKKDGLMVKDNDGNWVKQTINLNEKNNKLEENNNNSLIEEKEEDNNNTNRKSKRKVENNSEIEEKKWTNKQIVAFVKRKRRVIGEIANDIMGDPEKNLHRIDEIQILSKEEYPELINQLAIASLTEILIDLVPGYRIHVMNTKDIKLSKDVFKLQKYESLLVLHYGRLVSKLFKIIKDMKHGKVSEQLGLLAIKCASRMLKAGYHFNHRSDLIAAVVPKLNHSSIDIRKIVRDAIEMVFRLDTTGDASVEIAKRLSKMVAASPKKIRADVLDCLLVIPFSYDVLKHTADRIVDKSKIHINPKLSKKQQQKIRKEKRKERDQEEMELQRDIDLASAEVSMDHRKRSQTALLTEVFTMYFRILKQLRTGPVLASVLRGLAKFAHLINVEIVLDLLEYLKVIITEELPLESSLNCMITAFETISHHSGAITIDLKDFHDKAYQLLFQFILPENYEYIPLMLRAADHLFRDRKLVPIDRVAAFVNRLTMIAMYVPPYISISLIHLMRQLMIAYPKVEQLFDIESVASGGYLYSANDPDYSNPFAYTAWPITLLTQSFHPYLSTQAKTILKHQKRADSILHLKPVDLYDNFDSRSGIFNPSLPDITTSTKKIQSNIAKHWNDRHCSKFYQLLKEKFSKL